MFNSDWNSRATSYGGVWETTFRPAARPIAGICSGGFCRDACGGNGEMRAALIV